MNPAVFHRRCIFLCLVCVTGLSGLSARLVYLHVVKAEDYVEKSERVYRETALVATRGSIVDRDGIYFAYSIPRVSISVDKTQLFDRGAMAQKANSLAIMELRQSQEWTLWSEAERKAAIESRQKEITDKLPDEDIVHQYVEYLIAHFAQPLGMTPDELRKRLQINGKKRGDVVIRRDISEDDADKLKEIADDCSITFRHHRAHRYVKGRNGVFVFNDEQKRSYTELEMAAHLLGFVAERKPSIQEAKKLSALSQNIEGLQDEIRGAVSLSQILQIPRMQCELAIAADEHHMISARLKPQGRAGIEARMNAILAGQDGHVITRPGKLDDETKPPKHGLDVQLTIDIEIQRIVEEELDKALSESGAAKGTVIVMNPKTGAILGMVSRPTYNLNTRENIAENGFDYATQAIYEPGSTFKVVAISAAMDEGLIQPDSVFDCKTMWSPIKVRDWKLFEDLTVEEILAKSSNVGAYKIALEVGPSKFFGYAKSFGFGAKTGIPMTGESAGWLINTGNPTDFSRVSFGYGVSVTPLQIACAYSAIANGGKLMKPRLLKSIIGNNGVTHQRYEPVQIREVMTASTAAKMRQGLATVVATGGTGTRAAVEGFAAAGKTGTTQMLHPDGGYYNGLNDRESRYTVSFAGMLPADDPEFVCVVVVEDPETGIPTLDAEGNLVASPKVGGGSVAAPIFSRVATRVANELGLRPHLGLAAQ